eukprot:5794292-Pleurochrysis_carterae.AAC.1
MKIAAAMLAAGQRGTKGAASIEARWGMLSRKARQMAVARHADDIVEDLSSAGCEDWLPLSFILALKKLNMWEDLLSSRALADLKFDFAKHLGSVLSAEWGPPLALFLRTELSLSDSDYLKLRLAFCKRYDSNRELWTRRVWGSCPVTQRVLHMPEPLVARSAWFGEWRSYVQRCSGQPGIGPVDARLYTAISGKRAFTHASLSLGAMYRQARRMQTEMKTMRLAMGQCHDDNAGLGLMLSDKPLAKAGRCDGASLADEIASPYRRETLALKDETTVKCRVKCCLDLAAARGLRGSRGKAVCLCTCRSLQKQSYPGDETLADLPDVGAQTFYPSTLILQAAAHMTPATWTPAVDGAWRCKHCGEKVFADWSEFEAAKAQLDSLKDDADGGDGEA